jgi:glycosyltransferase involved in cell wall biosynthesis
VTSNPVGLVHDYLLTMRGAERTFAAIADCWPDAPIYTTLYSEQGTRGHFDGRDLKTSYLQRLGVGQRGFRRLLPLYPRAVERLPVSSHDLLISSSSAFAHGIRPAEAAVHICYCHSPFRYVWHEHRSALEEVSIVARPLLNAVLSRIRRWDLEAQRRVTHYVANSALTKERIGDFYEREAVVVHPPVEVDRFRVGDPEDYFLVVTELARHKRVELALEGARIAGAAVTVVGEGPDLGRLKAAFGSSARFVGSVSDSELVDLYARARALLVPSTEEFGIAMVEAQAAGRPVLAVDAGGAKEIVIDGETGVLVSPPTADTFAEALREVDFGGFSPERIRRNAERFSAARFKQELVREVERLVAQSAGSS